MDTTELVVTEAAEVVKNTNVSTLKVAAKYGLKGAVGLAAIYGLYCAGKKAVGLFMKDSKKTKPEEVDLMDMDLDDDEYQIDK